MSTSDFEKELNLLSPLIQKRYLAQPEDSKHKAAKPTHIASMIDHTLLKPNVLTEDVISLCKEAREHRLFSVCIPPSHIPIAKKELRESDVKICTVVGFPLGTQTSASKTFEARNAIEIGADEIDMVLNVSALKSKKYDLVFKEIETIKQVCSGKTLKVILETSYLTKEEIILSCIIVRAAGADFVKTSTGFAPTGATKEDIELMRKVVGKNFGVKASGGIRTKEDADIMIAAGASRLGCSASLQIIGATKQTDSEQGNY